MSDREKAKKAVKKNECDRIVWREQGEMAKQRDILRRLRPIIAELQEFETLYSYISLRGAVENEQRFHSHLNGAIQLLRETEEGVQHLNEYTQEKHNELMAERDG